ncbi:MAG TPA: PPOX class F420-dependent oxidoreductase [Candidatus Saccharimonadales bacterium]|nr:PPOX class F420-dependent oxidoreductase [Candidatus Saccharimonadales bacterium]
MAHEAALEFLRRNPRGVLATYRRDGQAQLSPVLAAVDADDRVVISTREGAIKTRNLRRTSRAALCVLSDRFFGAWHTIEGDVAIVALPDAMEPLVDYYRRVSGEHPDWQEYREAMARERRVLLRITVDRSGPTTQG